MIYNSMQVGGTHYITAYQVWDLVSQLHLDFFEGNILRYITRNMKKDGKTDLLKAMHYLQKMQELVECCGKLPMHLFPTEGMLEEFASANRLDSMELACVTSLCNWRDLHDLAILEERIKILLQTYDKK